MFVTTEGYTLTGRFIRYTLLVQDWTSFCLQNCLNYSWHRFDKVLETFLRDFGPYWHDSITQLLHLLLTLPSECRSRNRDSSDQATFFQSSIVQVWWACVNCSLRFMFLADRSGTRCGLLLSASGFEMFCVQRWYSAYLGCNKWLFELLLPFYHL